MPLVLYVFIRHQELRQPPVSWRPHQRQIRLMLRVIGFHLSTPRRRLRPLNSNGQGRVQLAIEVVFMPPLTLLLALVQPQLPVPRPPFLSTRFVIRRIQVSQRKPQSQRPTNSKNLRPPLLPQKRPITQKKMSYFTRAHPMLLPQRIVISIKCKVFNH